MTRFKDFGNAVTEHQPRLDGDHPYRTTTKFARDEGGKLLWDDEGYLVPLMPDLEGTREVLASTPEERASKRKLVTEKKVATRKAMAKDKRRINKRQSIGNPNCAQSRDEDFPLLAVLRRDGMKDSIRVVTKYRKLVALCAADPLKGQSYTNGDTAGMATEYLSEKLRGVAEVDAAAKAGFKGGILPGGEIEYTNAVRRSKGAYSLPPKRKKKIDVDAYFEGEGGSSMVGTTESLHIRVTEDILIERVDARPRLDRIRSALGPLLDPFEDAVLGGQTLQKIGRDAGFHGSSSAPAGKALVMRAITEAAKFFAEKPEPANDNYLIARRKIA